MMKDKYDLIREMAEEKVIVEYGERLPLSVKKCPHCHQKFVEIPEELILKAIKEILEETK